MNGVVSNDLERPWVTARFSKTRSVARPLCDCWAFCSVVVTCTFLWVSIYFTTVFMTNECILQPRRQRQLRSTSTILSALSLVLRRNRWSALQDPLQSTVQRVYRHLWLKKLRKVLPSKTHQTVSFTFRVYRRPLSALKRARYRSTTP